MNPLLAQFHGLYKHKHLDLCCCSLPAFHLWCHQLPTMTEWRLELPVLKLVSSVRCPPINLFVDEVAKLMFENDFER